MDPVILGIIATATSSLIGELYKDILSSKVKKITKSLGNVTDDLKDVIMPTKIKSEKKQLIFLKNLKKYKDELEKYDEEKIESVAPEIAEPILQRFEYVTNEHLANAFHNLLINASLSHSAPFAHPGFISIIDRLSPDECKILSYLAKPHSEIPFVYIIFTGDNLTTTPELDHETMIEKVIDLSFPRHAKLHFINLMSLGLLTRTYITAQLYGNEKFVEIQKFHFESIEKSAQYFEKQGVTNLQMEKKNGYYELTELGEMFMHACTIFPEGVSTGFKGSHSSVTHYSKPGDGHEEFFKRMPKN